MSLRTGKSIDGLEISSSSHGNPSSSSCCTQEDLKTLLREASLQSLREHGGVDGIASALRTDKVHGIRSGTEIERRREEFGSNTHPKPPTKRATRFVWEACKDPTNLLFLTLAVLSLGFDIKQHGLEQGWYNGGIIFLVLFMAIFLSSISNLRHATQFHEKMSLVISDIKAEVVRNGRRQQIPIIDVVVGDVVHLKIGDQVPADGLFLNGNSLQVDESSLKKEASSDAQDKGHQHPFLFSGTKVVDGYGTMLVTCVGVNTKYWSQMMNSVNQEVIQQTPADWKLKLSKFTSWMRSVGLAVSLLVLLVFLIAYFIGDTAYIYENRTKQVVNGGYIVNVVVGIIAAVVTIVAIPEWLPLAVTVTLAYSMKKLMANQAMVRELSACETMGHATIICTDKTGTLTLNKMKVTKFWHGQEPVEEDGYSRVDPEALRLIQEGVALNTTGSVYKSESDNSVYELSGSPTEKALLSWAVLDMEMNINEELRRSYTVLHEQVFNSEKKRSGVLIRKKADNKLHVHWKGAAEVVLRMCSKYCDASGNVKDLDSRNKLVFEQIIQGMAASSLRCIAFAHTEDVELENESQGNKKVIKEEGLTLLGVVGIKDLCRPGVKKAIEDIQHAGINVKLITGDDVFTAKAIATECGILQPDHQDQDEAVVQGEDFENYSDEERLRKVDKISVMARSSPSHKLLMVKSLKQKGDVVAVVGDGTDDAPALKEANIGLCMGTQGTQVAKESSDFIILDDDFAAVARVLRFGQWMRDCHYKFVSVLFIVNVVAIAINLLATFIGGEPPLPVGHLCLGNMIVYVMGTVSLINQDPMRDASPLERQVTNISIRDVIWNNVAKVLYQVAFFMILKLGGKSIFTSANVKALDNFIFSIFVLCQVFYEFYDSKVNPVPISQFLGGGGGITNQEGHVTNSS